MDDVGLVTKRIVKRSLRLGIGEEKDVMIPVCNCISELCYILVSEPFRTHG